MRALRGARRCLIRGLLRQSVYLVRSHRIPDGELHKAGIGNNRTIRKFRTGSHLQQIGAGLGKHPVGVGVRVLLNPYILGLVLGRIPQNLRFREVPILQVQRELPRSLNLL